MLGYIIDIGIVLTCLVVHFIGTSAPFYFEEGRSRGDWVHKPLVIDFAQLDETCDKY